MVPKKTSERSSHPRGVDVKHAAVILLHGTSIIIQEAPPFCPRWNVWSAWAFTGQKQEKFSAVRGNRWGSLSPAGESIGQVVTPSRKHIQDVQSPSQHKGTLLILPGSQTPSSSGRGLVFFPPRNHRSHWTRGLRDIVTKPQDLQPLSGPRTQIVTVVDAWGISTEANNTSRDKARHRNEHCRHPPPTVPFRSFAFPPNSSTICSQISNEYMLIHPRDQVLRATALIELTLLL